MAKKVYLSGNYLYIDDTVTGERVSGTSSAFQIISPTTLESSFIVMKNEQSIMSLSLVEIVKEDGVTPYTETEFITFIETSTGTTVSSNVNPGPPVSSDGLTNEELRATPVEVSDGSLTTLMDSLLQALKTVNSVSSPTDSGILILAKRKDSDSTLVDDGGFNSLNMDEKGRLKVASQPSSYADISGDITAIQATINTPVVGGTVVGDVSRASNLMAFCTGTFAGVNVTFEGSLNDTGETSWFGIQAVRTNANTIETTTGALSAQPVYGWELSVNALKRFRVRCTARTSGTQSWKFVLGTYATEPIPASQVTATQPVSGTVTANQGTLVNPTVHVLNSLSTTNPTSVKNSTGTIYNILVSNLSASVRYLKLFNKASVPIVGTDIPIVVITLPANSFIPINFGSVGFRPSLGIAYSITGAAADSDTTVIGAGEIKVITSFI